MSILKFIYKISYFSIFVFGVINVNAQKKIDKNNFGASYDFTQSPITTILKDHEGFLWIGTYGDGLYKFNSIDFKKYNKQINSNKRSLNSSIILSSLNDNNNNVWIGSQKGLNKYNSEFDDFETIKLKLNNELVSFEIYVIKEFDSNTLLIGTENGLYKFNKVDFTLFKIPFKDKNRSKFLIDAIIQTKDGSFLIGSSSGILTFDPNKEVLNLAKFQTEKGQVTIEAKIISMLKAKDNSIWIGTNTSGILKLTKMNSTYKILNYPITKKRILSLAQKDSNFILAGTENDGLFVIDCKSGKSKNYRYNKLKQNLLKSNSIWTIYTDDEKKIWLGYYRNGIDLYDPNYNKFNAIESTPYLINSLNSKSVSSIAMDKKGMFWIGTNEGGVDVYNPSKATFVNLYNQKNNIAKGLDKLDIQTIFIDSKNNKWVGTWNSGLYLLNNGEKRFKNFNHTNTDLQSNRIMSFDEDSKGVIWIATYSGGLYSFDKTVNKITHHKFSDYKKYNLHKSSIRKVLVDQMDNVWIATRNGAFKIKKDQFNSYNITSLDELMNKKEGKSNDSIIINSIYEDFENNIWIGTMGYGLYKYNNKKQSLKWYNINNGLIHEQVNLITQDKSNHIWIGGNKGLSKLNEKENTFINFSKKDGLLSNNFNFNAVYNSPNSTLYFGNSNGINYFNPDNVNYNQIKPKVYLTNLKISNEDIHVDSPNSPLTRVFSKTTELELRHYQSVLTFEYVGVNFTRSTNNKYAYYLEGYEKDWNYVGSQRSASYKNISPGKYKFKVKAANNDGLWEESPTVLHIVILDPWWATNLAWAAYFFLFLIVFYVITKIIKERIKEKQLLSFEIEKHKQFEVLNTKKIQFFTNISHEFRTPLTLILSPLEDILDDLRNQIDTEVKDKLKIIQKNAKRLSRLITELMDFRKVQFNKMTPNVSLINAVPFVKEVINHFEEEALANNINLTLEFEDIDITIWFDPSMLEKIMFNLLSNAFKATPEGGMITVQILQKTSDLIMFPLIDDKNPIHSTVIIIKDTGIGIKEENLDKVFDRFHQADEMNDQYYGGTGIGLELVKRFMDLHKGKIILESKINEGSQFKLFIPQGNSHIYIDNIKENPIKAINIFSESKIEENQKDENLKNKKTILLVEDNIELRTYLKNELKEEYNIKEAKNGIEGLEKANIFIPDVIVTDVMMPKMDGFEFCKRIKNDLITSHIPILMLTAKGLDIDKVKGIDSGADIYLNKPFNMKVLKSYLNQLITTRQVLFKKYFNSNSSNVVISEKITSLDKEFINNVLDYINENLKDEKLNVETLASKLCLSRSKLYRKIKALTGDTANEFIRKVKLEKAKNLIESSDFSISEISFKVGFSSPSYFTKCFKDYFGAIPTEIRK